MEKELFTLTPYKRYALLGKEDGIYLWTRPEIIYKPEESPINGINEPVVDGMDVAYYEGEILPLSTLMYGLSAFDEIDGDLSQKVVLDSVTYADGTATSRPLILNTDKEKIGKGTLSFTVLNSVGLSATKTISFYILPNQQPTLSVDDTYYFQEEVKDLGVEEVTALCEKNVTLSDDVEIIEELKKNYQLTQHIDVASEGAFTVDVKVKDQYGHRFYMLPGEKKQYGQGKVNEKQFKFHIVNDTSIENRTSGYVRFISLEMLYTLDIDSIWRSPEYYDYLNKVLHKDPNNEDDCQEIWTFNGDEVREIKQDILNNPDPFSKESNENFREKWKANQEK